MSAPLIALAEHVGERFVFRTDAGPDTEATLVTADAQQRGDAHELVLTFHAEAGAPAQGTYQVVHPQLPTVELFVVPHAAREFAAVITWLSAP